MSNDRSVYYIAAIFFFVETPIPGKSFTTNRWVVYVAAVVHRGVVRVLAAGRRARGRAKRPVVGRPAVQFCSVRPCIFKYLKD